MANKHDTLLKLTRPQLIALAVQKKVALYPDAQDKTKGQLIELMRDVEGILTPVKTWGDDEDMLDQQVIEELVGTEPD